MSSSNREQLLIKEESTPGVAVSGAATEFAPTTIGLSASNNSVNSATLRSDTNVAGTTRVGVNVGGDIGFELRYGAIDDLVRSVLRGTWSTALNVTATDITFTASDNSINSAGAGFGNAVAGQWIRISGNSVAGNNGYARVVTATSSKLTLSGLTIVDDAAGDSVTVKGSVMKNGTTEKYFSMERGFLDITQYSLFQGVKPVSLNLAFATESLINGSFGTTGFQIPVRDTSSFFTGPHTAAPTTEVMNTVDNIKRIVIDGATSTANFTSLDFAITTNDTVLKKLGALVGTKVAQYSIGVSGSISTYLEDATFQTLSDNFTPFDLATVVEDAAGNAYVFHFPQCYLTSGDQNNQGIDNENIENYAFSAVLDPTQLITGGITRIPA